MRRTESRLKGVNRSSITLVFMPMRRTQLRCHTRGARFREVGRAPPRERFQTEHDASRRNGLAHPGCASRSDRAYVRDHALGGEDDGQLADCRLDILEQVLTLVRDLERA